MYTFNSKKPPRIVEWWLMFLSSSIGTYFALWSAFSGGRRWQAKPDGLGAFSYLSSIGTYFALGEIF